MLPEISLPVVAHRILGTDYRGDTIQRRIPAYVEDDRWLAWAEMRTSKAARGVHGGGTTKGARNANKGTQRESNAWAPRITPGTRRTIDEIRDFFDGGHRADSTGSTSINRIWAAAGIRFQPVAIIDHAIRSTWSLAIDVDHVKELARDLNTTGMINLYFFRDLIGANGVGGFSPLPMDNTRWNIAYAAVEDWEEISFGASIAWQSTVRTAAHELGHLLKLRHNEDRSNLMWPPLSDDACDLQPLQIMVAYEHAKHYLTSSRRLCRLDTLFKEHYYNVGGEPLLMRAYLGDRLKFGQHRG